MTVGHVMYWELSIDFTEVGFDFSHTNTIWTRHCLCLLPKRMFLSLTSACSKDYSCGVYSRFLYNKQLFHIAFPYAGLLQLEEHFRCPIVLARAGAAVVLDWAESILLFKQNAWECGGGEIKICSGCSSLLQACAALFWNPGISFTRARYYQNRLVLFQALLIN